MNFILHPEADEELFESAGYYEKHSEGLGEEFLIAVGEALRRIDTFPAASRADSQGIRRRRVMGFPFNILYQRQKDSIFIVAIAHHRRRSDYWVERLFN